MRTRSESVFLLDLGSVSITIKAGKAYENDLILSYFCDYQKRLHEKDYERNLYTVVRGYAVLEKVRGQASGRLYSAKG